jgi:hypothetical protein
MTQIHFERSGGLLGNNINLDLDLDQLPEDQSQAIHQMILDSDFYQIPENLNGTTTPDEFHYVITVRAGQSEHTVQATNTTMPNALSPLVAELSVIHAVEEDTPAKSE